MLKFGVVGIGGIAQKAYLPTYVKNQQVGEYFFATSKASTKKLLVEDYGFTNVFSTLSELIEQGIDACFIHSATSSHFELAKKCLEHGIHVFVDKPASQNYAEVEVLQHLADEQELVFMVGFNRRHAPMVERLKQVPNKRFIRLEKHLAEKLDTTTFGIYDIFIHLIDTAVYLLDEPIVHVKSRIVERDNHLEIATLELLTEHSIAQLTMDLFAGAGSEDYFVTSPSGSYTLSQLTELTAQTPDGSLREAFGDWEDTLSKRGFTQQTKAFMEAVKTGNTGPLKQEDVLLSHKLCLQMLTTHARHLL
jgi:virulence factor